MPEMATLMVAAVFLLAGTIKGVIGFGLPTVSLAILTVALDLPGAMALLLVPSFATNLWQASIGGNARQLILRLWPFLLCASLTVWIGAMALIRVDMTLLSALLGALLMFYAAVSLAGVNLHIAVRWEGWSGPLAGLINGLLTGMTGSFVVPGVMYLNGLGLSRGQFLQAMGMLFTLSTLMLALALGRYGLIGEAQLLDSTIALLPAMAGVLLGQVLRARISESVFRRTFFLSLLTLGAYIAFSSIREFVR
ncbi:MAG: sulfite exporter TauE/SafE family protein [Gammaproteobacteria bacterium]|jgi:hypothetical protein|nr:sulfite exporter TauE/SafE family protein [Gammaproteobacteria bacterium]